jgi:hypothetical protein
MCHTLHPVLSLPCWPPMTFHGTSAHIPLFFLPLLPRHGLLLSQISPILLSLIKYYRQSPGLTPCSSAHHTCPLLSLFSYTFSMWGLLLSPRSVRTPMELSPKTPGTSYLVTAFSEPLTLIGCSHIASSPCIRPIINFVFFYGCP